MDKEKEASGELSCFSPEDKGLSLSVRGRVGWGVGREINRQSERQMRERETERDK